MQSAVLRKTVSVVAIVGVLGLAPVGCASIERETGLNRNTQSGALAGAAFGGIVAALANANPAWIAASIILGGVAGGAIGDYLGKQDAQTHAQTNLSALDTLGAGKTSSWTNDTTGNSGSTTVTAVNKKADGTVCKSYTEVVKTGAKTVTEQATACKAPGGNWQHRSA